jgi:DNA-binding PadR family transcriptional regulator
MKKTGIGEFEELVLLTTCVLKNEAYAFSIKQEIELRTGRRMNISAIHTTLYRMEDKGLLTSEMGEASRVRGGKRKRLFSATTFGIRSLSEIKDIRSSLWNDIPSVVLKNAEL